MKELIKMLFDAFAARIKTTNVLKSEPNFDIIHGFGFSHFACVVTGVLFSDVNKFFIIMLDALVNHDSSKLSAHPKCLTCVVDILLAGKLL